MRVLFVGDSMTIGAAGDFTWRYRMWQHLQARYGAGARGGRPDDGEAARFRVVGPRDTLHEGSHAYADPAFPAHARAHLAGWGEGWLHMAPVIGGAVRAHRPDTLLVALGLIDLGFYTNAEQTDVNVRRFLAEARRARPDIRAVLLPVLPNVRARTDPAFAAECARFNALLARAVADLSRPHSPLLLAAPPPDWHVGRDTYDGTHPSPAGEHRLAAAFAGTLHRAWQVGGPYVPEPDTVAVPG